ncbi:MAG: hypothetical protein GWN01_13930 [Nitrosopumilaceae archaeon]|nr:hypothetical protein [Nitrosopumilaceae archaeon]NIU88378.1 hypothetical protein [Nitrosopumilaceae archaeon]NIV66659.1 hypothetical protein [Nitrosopumilaceae archaeon]NIX62563.1 hypothetical protein [Nitrosopumilaceae archaeon]
MAGRRRARPSREKAKKILREGKARGHKLTPAQKRFFGARAGGAPTRGLRRKKR